MADDPKKPERKTFTGITRRQTRRGVKVVDFLAKYVITVGGIGVTVFFAAIIGFLAWIVFPLFKPPAVDKLVSVQIPVAKESTGAKPVAMEVEESLKALWMLDTSGVLSTYRVSGGEMVNAEPLSGDQKVTAISNERGTVAIGRADGTVRVGQIKYDSEFIQGMPDVLESLNRGETVGLNGGVAVMTPAGPRLVKTLATLSEPLAVAGDKPSPVALVDYLYSDRMEGALAYLEDGRLVLNILSKTKNLMTGKETRSVDTYELPKPACDKAGPPVAALIAHGGRGAYVVYKDGYVIRYNAAEPEKAFVAEQGPGLVEAGRQVASVRMLAGNTTIIVADSAGEVSGFFAAPYAEDYQGEKNADGHHLQRAHRLPKQTGGVTAIATSGRDRQFVTAGPDGKVVLRHMTSGTNQATIATDSKSPIVAVAMSPKVDAIAAIDADHHLTLFSVDNPHADGGLAALFTRIHYEGYADAQYVWQSSAATDDAEPKMSLMPLIFGTFKATFYALLFAIPVAIAAAIYTSEFMPPRVRSVVKPVIEMMASLPSVVLGFIAALVLAPFIEDLVPAVLLTFVAIPVGVMLFGFVWQVLPPQVTRGLPSWAPFATMLGLVVLSLYLSFHFGTLLEEVVFYGDFRGWLGRRVGTGVPGWVCLLAPLITVALVLFFNLKLRRHIPLFNGTGTRLQVAVADLARFAVTGVVAIGIAYAIGAALTGMGLDLRDDWMAGALRISPTGAYAQRNTLILGMIMGFAIIPIIYTVSEDALNSVPASLRSAALGAGATPWQTAIRVVLPVAVSGIFSACMIGLGRAAGETMIVLMAGGNTALMDMNIFNGVRTLSANIAVELPEAPVASTHYRVLFLSALVLFALTFVVNTTAEVVRARFRKRAYQL